MGVLDKILLARMQAATASAERKIAGIAGPAKRHAPPPREGPMRVLMLASQPEIHAGTRHRLSIWADRLRARGHDVRLSLPIEGDDAERVYQWGSRDTRYEFHRRVLEARAAAIREASAFDVAVIHMTDIPNWEYGSPFVARALARTAGRVLLDLDDLPVVRGETSPGPRARELVAAVDGLIAGNAEIARWFPERPSWLVPTCIDTDGWPAPAREPSTSPLLGWIGTSGALPQLEALAPVLADLRLRVRVICDAEPRLPGVAVDFVRWTGGREHEDLAAVDIGLAPLSDGPMERCKCGLKALEYAASASAVVASPVGVLRDIVEDGRTGVHASSLDEWRSVLTSLAADPARRIRMGRAGRQAVETRWSAQAHEAAFEAALRGIH